MFKYKRRFRRITRDSPITSRTHLDFGCGSQPRNPFGAEKFFTVDVFRSSPEIPTDLIQAGEPFPYEDNFFSSVSAFDVVEHLSRDSAQGNQFIFYMKEIYRVLEPGGLALVIFPAFPHRDAFSDPTHINFITPRTVDYFVGNKLPPFYAGIDTNFELLINKPLRFWKKWVVSSDLSHDAENEGIRRRLSLAKRTLMRCVNPQHRIWLLLKPYER
jgi:SAM-dependent methyltransferase